jgi:carbonic anhydrase
MDIIYRYDQHQPIELAAPPDAASAIDELVRGNQRLADIVARMQARTAGGPSGEPLVIPMCPVSLGLPIAAGQFPAQSPFALIVNCSDARVSTEAVFDQSFNAMFVVRVAGNVLCTELLGSVDYAVKHLTSLRVAVVLGHTECGAVSAAVEAYLAPDMYVEIAHTHALRSLVDRIQIAVRAASQTLRQVHGEEVYSRPGYRRALRELTIYLNAAITAFDLAREIRLKDDSPIEVVFAVYDISTVQVRADPDGTRDTPRMFAPAPASSEEFAALKASWAASPAIARLLG